LNEYIPIMIVLRDPLDGMSDMEVRSGRGEDTWDRRDRHTMLSIQESNTQVWY
jgi:hypothetical protein